MKHLDICHIDTSGCHIDTSGLHVDTSRCLCVIQPSTRSTLGEYESYTEGLPDMSDITGRKMVERPKMNVGILGLRTARRVKAPGNIPHILASGGRLVLTER